MEDLFGSLKSELSCLRHELNEEIEKVKSTVNDMETSLNARGTQSKISKMN